MHIHHTLFCLEGGIVTNKAFPPAPSLSSNNSNCTDKLLGEKWDILYPFLSPCKTESHLRSSPMLINHLHVLCNVASIVGIWSHPWETDRSPAPRGTSHVKGDVRNRDPDVRLAPQESHTVTETIEAGIQMGDQFHRNLTC